MTQAELQLSQKVILRQKTFEAMTFFAFRLEQEQGWRPQNVKTAKSTLLFFDVDFYRNKIFRDELFDTFIRINLGVQPSAAASHWSRAEIEKEYFMCFARFGKRLIDFFPPLNGHMSPPESSRTYFYFIARKERLKVTETRAISRCGKWSHPHPSFVLQAAVREETEWHAVCSREVWRR